jgi:hypothetical protein
MLLMSEDHKSRLMESRSTMMYLQSRSTKMALIKSKILKVDDEKSMIEPEKP